MNAMKGILYVTALPLGNLEDITLRALDILKNVDAIACEDTRHLRKLLSFYGIKARLISYYEQNEREQADKIISLLKKGNSVALVSDAGTPLISDPGYILVNKAIEMGFNVVPIPGATAFVSALSVSGLPCDRFFFVGFLPRKKGRKTRLKQIKEMSQINGFSVIFYEAPHRIERLIKELILFFGEDVLCFVAREMTKKHEQYFKGSLSDVLSAIENKKLLVKGEFVVIIYLKNRKDHV